MYIYLHLNIYYPHTQTNACEGKCFSPLKNTSNVKNGNGNHCCHKHTVNC